MQMTKDSKASHYRQLAFTISNQAKAIAEGNHTGPVYGAVQLLKSNIETLEAWTEDDRSTEVTCKFCSEVIERRDGELVTKFGNDPQCDESPNNNHRRNV
jgi:hypothetical protein